MESNQCDQGGGDSGDDQDALKQVINIRSYECNFCKRGFSNAQALGGHMNIHRKDKAKLKQQSNLEQGNSSEELNKLILLPNLNSNIHVSQKQDHQQHIVPSRSEENILVIDHTRQLQLPLFSQSPMKNEMQNPQGDQIQREITTTITTIQEPLLLSSDDQDSSSELDLELRLGSEPHDSSKPTGTRKFF